LVHREFQLSLNTRDYLRRLLVIVVSLVFIHCLLHLYQSYIAEVPWLLMQLFELDEENNLPTFFSGYLLLNNAFFLYLIACANRHSYTWHWYILAFGFLTLSVDEIAGLHETFNTATDINWAIPAGVLVLLGSIFFVPFLLSLNRRLAFMFVVSGAIYLGGAVGIELLSQDMDEDSLAYGFATALEEGMELFGAWLFLAVNLEEMRGENTRLEANVSLL